MRLWLLVAAAVAAGGCANNDPCDNVIGACIALTVDGSGSVDTLRLGLSGAATAQRIAPTRQTLTTLPVYVALQLGHATQGSGAPFTGGDVRIDVEASRSGAVVGSASTHVMIASGQHVNATVTLAAGPLPAGDDLSAPPDDLAAGCSTTDLAVLANDPHNCGSCGHDCLGGTCAGGRCQPMVVAQSPGAPYGVAVDAANVYFSSVSGSNRGVTRAPLAGGAPVVIYASSTTSILGLALASGKLIVDDSYLHLESLPVPGGATSLTAGFDGALNTFAVDATHVYFATSSGMTLRSLGLDLSGLPTDVGTIPQSATALASDGTTLYYGHAGGIAGIALPSGSPQVLIGNTGSITGLAVDGNTLWATTVNNSVLTLQRSGNVLTLVDTISGQLTPVAITVDAGAVYWTNQGDFTVMRLAR